MSAFKAFHDVKSQPVNWFLVSLAELIYPIEWIDTSFVWVQKARNYLVNQIRELKWRSKQNLTDKKYVGRKGLHSETRICKTIFWVLSEFLGDCCSAVKTATPLPFSAKKWPQSRKKNKTKKEKQAWFVKCNMCILTKITATSK